MKLTIAVIFTAALLCGCGQKPDPRVAELQGENVELKNQVAALEKSADVKSNVGGAWKLSFGVAQLDLQLEDNNGQLTGHVTDQQEIPVHGVRVGKAVELFYFVEKTTASFHFNGNLASSDLMEGKLEVVAPGAGSLTGPQLWRASRK